MRAPRRAPRATRPTFTPGQPVWWRATLGGGGGSGHRPSPTERRAAIVLAVSPRSVQLRLLDRPAGFDVTRVRPTAVEARA